jgi:AraC-like DNA-binding protein
LRRHLGMTGTEFVNEARLQHAARELRLSDRPIAEIALDCGYDNLGYFYRRFKARFGRPPRQYRLSAGESRPDPT